VKKIEGDYLDAVVFRQIVRFVKVVSKIETQMSIVKFDPIVLFYDCCTKSESLTFH